MTPDTAKRLVEANPHPPRVQWSDIRLLYHRGYYDGPLSGMCVFRDEEHWLVCYDEFLRPTGGLDEYGDAAGEVVRLFAVLKLTPESHAQERARHADWRRLVGDHCDYPEGGGPRKRFVAKVGVQEDYWALWPRGSAEVEGEVVAVVEH